MEESKQCHPCGSGRAYRGGGTTWLRCDDVLEDFCADLTTKRRPLVRWNKGVRLAATRPVRY